MERSFINGPESDGQAFKKLAHSRQPPPPSAITHIVYLYVGNEHAFVWIFVDYSLGLDVDGKLDNSKSCTDTTLHF